MKKHTYNPDGSTAKDLIDFLQQFPENTRVYRINSQESSHTVKVMSATLIPSESQLVNNKVPDAPLPDLILIN